MKTTEVFKLKTDCPYLFIYFIQLEFQKKNYGYDYKNFNQIIK